MVSPGHQEVRLSQSEIDGTLRAVQRACQKQGVGWRRILLFGSRVDPQSRGGDIDLLIEIDSTAQVDSYGLRQSLALALEDELGERKIDVVIDDGTSSPFVALARARGVELWTND